tara:strand:- start:3475 stop:4290 length:816 start_codon:yes stop_codon:yes gene_type:complete
MENNTKAPVKGRQAAKTAASKPQAKSASFKPTIRREQKTNQVKEYRLFKKSGATFLMQQKNVTVVENDKLREIRYCPNEPSIYRDEQDDKSTREAVVFLEGRLFVRPDQPNLAEYLDAHPENEKNGGNRFYLYKEEVVSKKKLEDEFKMHDAISLIRTKELEELLSVSISFGIDIDRPVNEIKHDLMVIAKKSPQAFIESFDNPIVEMKTLISQADKYQVIKLTEKGAFWFDSNKLIVSVPAGKDPMDVFVRYCMTEAAVPVVEEIKKQLK